MPLHDGAAANIRHQLQEIAQGHRVSLIVIGCLTESQHRQLREFRAERGLTGGESPEIVYLGKHHYESRAKQGYTVNDMVQQIEWGISATSEPFYRGSMTSIWSIAFRDDGYGKRVRDQAIFELSARKPRVELYSVIPKGDGR